MFGSAPTVLARRRRRVFLRLRTARAPAVTTHKPTAPAAGAALVVEVEQTHPMSLAGAFRCEANELLALVGPSGAGKTSMLRILARLTRHPGTVGDRAGGTVSAWSSGRVCAIQESWHERTPRLRAHHAKLFSTDEHEIAMCRMDREGVTKLAADLRLVEAGKHGVVPVGERSAAWDDRAR